MQHFTQSGVRGGSMLDGMLRGVKEAHDAEQVELRLTLCRDHMATVPVPRLGLGLLVQVVAQDGGGHLQDGGCFVLFPLQIRTPMNDWAQ